ncbi:MAG: Asp-tRNA(Asn)/Glu-tRNA(Gln) amidotransferase subunit GatB [Deltaproteobacteria bacterium]
MKTAAYEPVIGLEVHVQLKTRTKVFCGCANAFGAAPNTHVCPVCLGLPGSLPVLNAEALRAGAKVGCALGCTARTLTKFDRKNYFYPDLPKNFQISQFDMPIAEHGRLEIDREGDGVRTVRIKRVHLEEDAGKLLHPEGSDASLVDFNRTGAPLLEIVSEPDLFSPEEAYAYLTELKLLLQYVGVSDCDMEKGSLRCDANISLRPAGTQGLGVKTELKNMNSFKAVRAALTFEIARQAQALGAGEALVQETRLWDENAQRTRSMRSKEEAHDYRYFPEPDLPPFTFTPQTLEALRRELPELPRARARRFCADFGLARPEAMVLISSREMADFFEEAAGLFADAKKVANWLMGPVLAQMNARRATLADLGFAPAGLVELMRLVEDGVLSHLAGKEVLALMCDTRRGAAEIVKEKDLAQVSGEEALTGIVEDVIRNNAASVADFRAGKEKALMFLVGQVMRLSRGKANPKVVGEILKKRLTS